MRLLIPLLILAATSSCSTVAQQIDPTQIYRADIRLKVNGVEGNGVMVAAAAPSYAIEASNKGLFNFVLLRTCHREFSQELAGNDLKYTYTPLQGVETSRDCPLQIQTIEAVKARDSSALIEFQDPAYSLPAVTYCNGAQASWNGVSICQSKVGLLQRIIFAAPVYMAAGRPECAFAAPADRMSFEFPMVRDRCLYLFREVGSGRLHRLTSRGYDNIVMRNI